MQEILVFLGVLASLTPAPAAGPTSSDLTALENQKDQPQETAPGAPRPFDHQRAGWQIGAAMAGGVIWYQTQIELNKLDFDFGRTFSDQWRRLATTDGYRFDDNNLTLNVGHAFMGSAYHQFARSNGGGLGEALLFDFLTSTTWELLVEHREVLSLNDTVTTSLGGVALGESLFQMGEFFARSRPTFRNRALMGLLSPARAVAWLTGQAPRPASAGFDRAGLAADASHDFSLEVGGEQDLEPDATTSTPWRAKARLDLELVNVAEYDRPGEARRRARGGEFTRIEAVYSGDREQRRQAFVASRASLWGHYRQRTEEGDRGLLGHATFVGSSTAFELDSTDLGERHDFLAAFHLLGPAVDSTLYRDAWRLRLAADLAPNFAMVRPFALHPRTGAEAGMKSTLVAHGYYYALGVSGAARLEATVRQLEAGVILGLSHFDSIEGLDRHQYAYTSPTGIPHAAIINDGNIVDDRLKMRLYSETPLLRTRAKLGVSLDYQRRSGTLADVAHADHDLRWGVHARYAM